jgi:hypothetical protein
MNDEGLKLPGRTFYNRPIAFHEVEDVDVPLRIM